MTPQMRHNGDREYDISCGFSLSLYLCSFFFYSCLRSSSVYLDSESFSISPINSLSLRCDVISLLPPKGLFLRAKTHLGRWWPFGTDGNGCGPSLRSIDQLVSSRRFYSKFIRRIMYSVHHVTNSSLRLYLQNIIVKKKNTRVSEYKWPKALLLYMQRLYFIPKCFYFEILNLCFNKVCLYPRFVDPYPPLLLLRGSKRSITIHSIFLIDI